MKDTATGRRVQRGIVLADSGAVEAHGDQYRVHGQGGTYLVDLVAQSCSCPDRAEVCKHQYAAQVVDSRDRCRRQKTAKPKTDRRHRAEADSLRDVAADIGPDQMQRNLARMTD